MGSKFRHGLFFGFPPAYQRPSRMNRFMKHGVQKFDVVGIRAY